MYLASFIDRDNSMVPRFGVIGAAQWREAPLHLIPVNWPCHRDSSGREQYFQVHHNLVVNFIKIKIHFKNLMLQFK